MSKTRTVFLTAALILATAGVAGGAFAANIVETAKADGHFTKLLGANDAAGTTGLLEGPGPFTVFAPNDDAFAAAPQDKLAALMRPENRTMLKVTLANHVVTGLLRPRRSTRGSRWRGPRRSPPPTPCPSSSSATAAG